MTLKVKSSTFKRTKMVLKFFIDHVLTGFKNKNVGFRPILISKLIEF